MITERRVPLAFYRRAAEAVHVETLGEGLLVRVAVSVSPFGKDAVMPNRVGRRQCIEVTLFRVEASLTFVHYGHDVQHFKHSWDAEDMLWLTREVSIVNPAHIDDQQVHAFVEGRGKYMPGQPRPYKMVADFVEARKTEPELELSRKYSIRLPKELIVRIVRPDLPIKPEE